MKLPHFCLPNFFAGLLSVLAFLASVVFLENVFAQDIANVIRPHYEQVKELFIETKISLLSFATFSLILSFLSVAVLGAYADRGRRISELKQSEKTLKWVIETRSPKIFSFLDVTGLPNRHQLESDFDEGRILTKSGRLKAGAYSHFCVCQFDRLILNAHKGDRLNLEAYTYALQTLYTSLRKQDLMYVYRSNTDNAEYVVFLLKGSLTDICQFIIRLRRTLLVDVGNEIHSLFNKELTMHFHCGIAQFCPDDRLETIFEKALLCLDLAANLANEAGVHWDSEETLDATIVESLSQDPHHRAGSTAREVHPPFSEVTHPRFIS